MLDPSKLYDHLKANAVKVHFFGLGFIQVKVSNKERYHFYAPELTAFVPPEEVHDHRYTFTSTILKGFLSQEIYGITPHVNGSHTLRYVSCDADKPAPSDTQQVNLDLLTVVHSNRGSQYKLKESALHRVLPVASNTITLLQREPQTKPFARVVSSSKEEVCPFSKDLPIEELWVWIKKIAEE